MRAPVGPLCSLAAVRTLVDGLDHPEGVALGPDGALYAGGEAGQIYRIAEWQQATQPRDRGSPLVRAEQLATTGGFILGLALDGRGNVYACDPGKRQVARITPAGIVSTYSNGTPAAPMVNPNFPVFDRNGRLYVANSGHWQQNDGVLYRIDLEGATTVASQAPRRFPNGLALSADDQWLYVAESTLPGVTRLRVGADGALGAMEEVVALPGDVPDGLALDAAGNLYITCYRPDRIYRYSARGVVAVFAEDPQGTVLAAPTNVALVGPRLDQIVIANLGRWHLAIAPVDVPGQPLHYPAW